MRKSTDATIYHNNSREGERVRESTDVWLREGESKRGNERERVRVSTDSTIYHNSLREGERVRESTGATINHY